MAELENLPYGLSSKPQVLKVRAGARRAKNRYPRTAPTRAPTARRPLTAGRHQNLPKRTPSLSPPRWLPPATPQKVRDWYVESFRDLRSFPGVKSADEEATFTDLLRHIYRRHVSRPWPECVRVC